MGLLDIIEKPTISGSNKFPGLPLLPHGVERYIYLVLVAGELL